jgi:hypothetical protein
VLQQATDALHYAHELRDRSGAPVGVVHRDVTPTNLFLTDAGVVKVLDFGIAKVKGASVGTQAGEVKGKYAYMAPEQLRGGAIDRRADVFALGIVVYEMLALRRLFQRKTDYLTFRAAMEQPIIDIRHYRPDCPDLLAAALTRALDRDPENRFASARQFGTAVLDSIGAARRPWTQGEISDFVRANFAVEIAARHAQIESAVRSGVERHTVPHIAEAEHETIDTEDEIAEFPPVDSKVSETPVDVRHLHAPSGEHSAVLGPVAPPPNLDVLRGVHGPAASQTPSQPIVVVERRSGVWPVVAIAMLAVAGCALFLVWRQTQRLESTPSWTINTDTNTQARANGDGVLTVGPSARTVEPAPPAAAQVGSEAMIGSAAGAAAASEPVTGKRKPPPRPTRAAAGTKSTRDELFEAEVQRQTEATNRCGEQHGKPPAGTRVQLVVDREGVPASVIVEPAGVAASPFGACVESVFRTARFPASESGMKFSVNLKPKRD